ncbi:MAG: T9SS type A sorting domain-containing protein [Bacteroidetes bacterium]|nr:T9SS type A sorting domain-containing protein [Bacteroidota bacterium]
MKIAIYFAVGLLLSSSDMWAQATAQRYTTPLAGTTNFSKIDDKYDAHVSNLEAPEPDGEMDKIVLEKAKEASAKMFPRTQSKATKKSTAVAAPIVLLSYEADTLTGVPPDNCMAVSNTNRTVSVMNNSIAIQDAQTGQMLRRRSLYQFTINVGLNNTPTNQNNYRYDPKVIYDPEADRFICVILSGINQYSHVIVGFSQSNNPDSTWAFYKFTGDFKGDTTWFDYPSIAITHNELFFTGNQIKYNTSWQAGFTQTIIYQVRKSDGYNAQNTLNYQIWQNTGFNGRNIRNLYPVTGGNALYGPEQYFLSNRNFDVQNDTVFLVKIPDTMGSANNTLTVTPLISNLKYGVPPNGRQKDTFTLATNDGRVLGAYRTANEIQFTSTTVHPISGSAAVYFGLISNITTSPNLQASYFGIDSLDFGYPNLSYAGNYGGKNHSILSFNFTGPKTNAGLGAIYYDGSQFSDMLVVKKGDTSINVMGGEVQRWGDYMGNQPQWNHPGVVWINGIFGKKMQVYGNYMAKLLSPFAVAIPNTPKAASDNDFTIYPNPSFVYVRLEFSLAKEANLSFYISDMQGKKIDRILMQHCEEGKNILQFNTASLPTGAYLIHAYNEHEKLIVSKKFLKQ